MMDTWSGSMMSTSSHTTPRWTHRERRSVTGSAEGAALLPLQKRKGFHVGAKKAVRSPRVCDLGPQERTTGVWGLHASYLSIIDVVNFIKDDPLQVPDDI